LNFTDSKDDLEVAARENAGHGKSIFELSELLQKIALKDKIAESSEFARRVQRSLYRLSSPQASARNRGVKKAPFVVLIGAAMPSILAEVGFVTNAREESLMRRSDYRDKLAEALCQGVSDYAATLSKMTVAQESAARPGQSTK
jgi:N-acetylmuramoyl-L-alanine amidase